MTARSFEGFDGLPTPRRYWSILSIALALTMAVLDSAIVNIALPTIAADLQATPADSIWIVNAYQIAIVTSLLPLASLGDRFGYRRVYQVGLLVFTLASLGCALSHSLFVLTCARVLQGLGASGIMSVNGALVRFTYPHRLLGRGVGLNALVVAASSAAGPSIASAILSFGPWQWLFWINVPLGAVTIVVAWLSLPRSDRSAHPFDLFSAVLSALAFGLIVAGVDWLTRGENVSLGALALAAGLGSGTFLILRERHQRRPLVPIDLLRIPLFALSIATSICSFTAQMLAFVALPFYFETTLNRTPVETGLLMTPWPIALAFVAPLSGSLADRYSAAVLGGIGLCALGTGLGFLAFLPKDATALDVTWRMAICGVGFGLFQAPNNRTMLSSAPRDRTGAAAGMLATARLTGQTTGATLVAIFFRAFPLQGEAISLATGVGFAFGAALLSTLRLSAKP